jgi:hypothetical protein
MVIRMPLFAPVMMNYVSDYREFSVECGEGFRSCLGFCARRFNVGFILNLIRTVAVTYTTPTPLLCKSMAYFDGAEGFN